MLSGSGLRWFESVIPYSISSVDYRMTNECLEAVVAGMDLKYCDRVLAIAGSGDQSFAFLEYAGRVHAVDQKSCQLQYIYRRAQSLDQGDIPGFLEAVGPGNKDIYYFGTVSREFAMFNEERRRSYFLKPGRLGRIRENLANFTSDKVNLLETYGAFKGFNKVYLSNIFLGDSGLAGLLSGLSAMIPEGGLIYVTHDPYFVKQLEPGSLPSVLCIDTQLSRASQQLEEMSTSDFGATMWHPIIYRRI